MYCFHPDNLLAAYDGPVPPTLSKSQLQKLGKRLAKTDEPDSSDIERLENLSVEHDSSLETVITALAELGYEATGRLKRTDAIIDKIRLNHSNLANLQDIAGCRVVGD